MPHHLAILTDFPEEGWPSSPYSETAFLGSSTSHACELRGEKAAKAQIVASGCSSGALTDFAFDTKFLVQAMQIGF